MLPTPKKYISETQCTQHGGTCDIVCVNCKEYVCYACAYKYHKDHLTRETDDVLKNLDSVASTMIDEISQLQHKHKKIRRVVEDQVMQLAATESKIATECSILKHAIENRNIIDLCPIIGKDTIRMPQDIVDASNTTHLRTELMRLIVGKGKSRCNVDELLASLQQYVDINPIKKSRIKSYCNKIYTSDSASLADILSILFRDESMCLHCDKLVLVSDTINVCTSDITHRVCTSCYVEYYKSRIICSKTHCNGYVIKYES